MTQGLRLAAIAVAVAVNGGALATLHAAMLQTAARETIALQQPARIVVTTAPATPALASAQSCPAPRVL